MTLRFFAALRWYENRRASKGTIVLEAQTLKEARDDPRWSRSSPEILLHDGAGCNRTIFEGGAGDQTSRVALRRWLRRIFRAGARWRWRRAVSGRRSKRRLRRKSSDSFGASAAGESDCFGEVEERPSGFGDAGAFVALRSVAGGLDGGSGDAGAEAAGAAADFAGAASCGAEEPSSCRLASTRATPRVERCVRQKGRAWLRRGGAAGGRPQRGGYLLRDDRRNEHHIQEQDRQIRFDG